MSGELAFIDCHAHFLPAKRLGKLIKWARSFMPDHPVPVEHTIEDMFFDYHEAGARCAVNLLYPIWPGESREINRFGYELKERYPGLVTFGGVHITDPDPVAVVREAVEEFGLAGLKFHPMVQHFSPAAPGLRGIYPYLHERGKTVYLHTGYDEWYNWRLPPEDVEWIIREHPRLRVVLSHMGFPRLNWAFDLAEKYPNVWLDSTNVFGSFAMMSLAGGAAFGEFTYEQLRGLMLDRLPALAARTFFGTDHPAGIGDLTQILAHFLDFGLPEDTQRQILLDTPRAFLGLSDEAGA